MKYFLIFLCVLAIFVFAIVLGVQNNQIVAFNYLVAQNEYRLSTLLAILFTLGFVLGWLICGLFYLRLRWKLINAERRLRGLQQPDLAVTKTNQQM